MWLRFIFPSWRFFSDFKNYPVILCQRPDGAWIPWRPTVRRSIFSLFHNPQENIDLAVQSLIERLLAKKEVDSELLEVVKNAFRTSFKILLDGEEILVVNNEL
jgi:hypothetical protein